MRVVIVVSAIGDGPKEVSITRVEDEASTETRGAFEVKDSSLISRWSSEAGTVGVTKSVGASGVSREATRTKMTGDGLRSSR